MCPKKGGELQPSTSWSDQASLTAINSDGLQPNSDESARQLLRCPCNLVLRASVLHLAVGSRMR